MALLVGLTLLLVMRTGAVPSRAEFTVNFQHDVTGTWRRPAVVPCSYVPQNFELHSVVWMHDGKRIFERDSNGDHTFVTKYRGRLSLPQDRKEGNVSLSIMDLQTDDKGTYTCQVSLIPDGATSRITKEADIYLAVEKVSVTKPVIQPGVSFLAVPERATINLTCSAAGSLPITYKWYKYALGSSGKVFQWKGASFTIDKANPSHSGIYICEAENQIPERKVQQSEEIRLSVTDTVTRPAQKTTRTPRVISGSAESPGKEGTLQTPGHSSTAAVATAIITADLHHSPGAPTWLIILVILLSLALICTLIAVLVTRSKNRKGTDGGTYEIPIMSQLDARANQDHPAARICRVSTCQANGSQAGAVWTNDIAVPRMENRYEPTMVREEEPHSDYQNALHYRESEYEQLLAEKESVQQT